MIVVVSRGHRPSFIYKGIGNAQVAKFLGTGAFDWPNLPLRRVREYRCGEISYLNLSVR
jgi:hypothetical protein